MSYPVKTAFPLTVMACALAAPACASVEPVSLGVVEVTAQKIRQNILEVPATVDVVGAEELALRKVDSLEGLGKLVNGLNVSSYTGGQPRIYLRGIGDAFDLKNKRVAVYVDGVPQLDSVLQDPMLLNNVERVEVLKGPQGTLYGRNAASGVINIITRRPEGSGVSGFAGVGSRSERRLGLDAHSSFYDDALRLGLSTTWLKGKGELTNIANGSRGDIDKYDRRNVSLKADFIPSSRTRVEMGFNHFDDKSAPYLQTFIDSATLRPIHRQRAGMGFEPSKFYEIDRDLQGYTRTRGSGATVKISHDFGPFRLNATTGYQKDKLYTVSDADYSSNPLVRWDFDPYINDHRQLSQEIQLVGKTDALYWQSGVFLYRDRTDNSNVFKTSFGNILSHSRYRTSGWAVYGQADYKLTPEWTLTGGGRFQHDKQQLRDVQKGLAEQSRSDGSGSYKVALAYEFRPDNTSFISYGTGYTPGGVNTNPQMVGGLPVGPYLGYSPEKTASLEWGLKGRLKDLGLGYSLSVYQTMLRDQQILDMSDTQIKNLGKTRYRGIELSAQYRFAPSWSVNAGYSRNDSRVDKSDLAAAVGKRVPFVPRDTGRLGLEYNGRLAQADLTLRADVNHVGRIEADSLNSFGQAGYQTVGLSARAEFKGWWLGVNVDNLFGKEYYSNVIANSPFAGTHTALYGQRRSVHLSVGGAF
ncbi:TonB-dependent receptor [Paludibacterium paludis]|uniref:Ligand-gated channel n=1 Tax=Paludibacterium paludis TaxID=1225769 RepID=A0A918U9Z8_9NEIS|nr:TonB-dependent receptor [Paludibacterium paludis]GGY18452.1 ligand-gated channel [Paludibacterium paludis]